jgi:glycosyltransferase involved in cell wall biosynthesis
MKILLIVFNVIGRGTYRRAFQFGRHLAARGHFVTLLVTSKDLRTKFRTYEFNGLTIVETPDMLPGSLRSGWDIWNTFARIYWIDNKQFDIVHAFESRPTVIFPSLYALNHGATFITDWSDWFGKGGSVEERTNPFVRLILRPIETFFENHFRHKAAGTTVICKTLFEKAITLGLPERRIRILPNGADIVNFHVVNKSEIRHSLGFSETDYIIGYLGTIFPRDAQLLSQAFNELVRIVPNSKLLIIGYCPIDIRKMVLYPGLVYQTGSVAEEALNSYLGACDICWLPLSNTGANRGRMPLKFMDYLSAGKPVIMTEVGDLAEIVNNEGVGLVTRVTPSDFALSTVELLIDSDRIRELSAKARWVAENRFNWNEITASLEDFYIECLD